jgi:dTDP-4-amino-4,6-dideoxygalactose transaminase
MKVPFVDLEAQYRSIRTSMDQAIAKSIGQFDFIRGRSVHTFEESFRKRLGAKHCIATSNGTSSLFIILKALGIGQGDEVITPAFSWISSSETISLCGARPVFADVDDTCTLDPTQLKKLVTKKTKAVIAVHLYGHAAQAGAIAKFCKKHDLFFIEDCAQAHFTQEHGKTVGTFGDASAFSFYPTKNLGAYGDAGCVITGDDRLAEKIRRFANHGALTKDDHTMEGMNSRMDSVQAAVLNAKLPYLKKWNNQRRKNARLYTSILKDVATITLPSERKKTRHTFHLYVIRAQHRDKLMEYLLKKGVQTVIHYPKALTNTEAYRHLHLDPDAFPTANALEKEVLSLPIYPELTERQIVFVCRNIKEFYRKVKSV